MAFTSLNHYLDVEWLEYAFECRLWQKWLSRRSSKSYAPWGRFMRMLERVALPPPRIVNPYAVG